MNAGVSRDSDSSSKVMGLPIRGQKVSWQPGPLPEEERSPGEGEKLSCLVMLSSSPGPVFSPLLPPEAKLHHVAAVISNGAGVQGLAAGRWQWQEVGPMGRPCRAVTNALSWGYPWGGWPMSIQTRAQTFSLPFAGQPDRQPSSCEG